jgi:lipopolysaccharide transport system permease protein
VEGEALRKLPKGVIKLTAGTETSQIKMDSRESGAAPRRVKVIRPPSFSWRGLANDLRALTHYRDLFYTLSLHRIKVRYKQSVLGVSWAIMQPLSLMLVYGLIFAMIVRVPTGSVPYTVFAYAGLLPWLYLNTALTNATGGLVSHNQLVTKVYFPREIISLTYVVAALFDFLVAAPVLAALMLYHRVPLTANLFYALPIMAVLTVFIAGAALALSAAQVRFRDIGVALPLFLQLWMFATPVVYPLSAVPARLQPFFKLNPLGGLIENFRRVVLEGGAPDFRELALAAALSLSLFALADIYFKHVDATMADII